jgi:uncharacterized DUF497 family protein
LQNGTVNSIVLEFDWDDDNLRHIERHSVTAEEAEFVLRHWTLQLGVQDWHDEERFAEAGVTVNGRILIVITTARGAKTRVVTAFDAPRSVAEEYRYTR